MAAVFLAFSLAGIVLPGVEDFYRKRLKRACLMVRYDKEFWVESHSDAEKGETQRQETPKPRAPAKSFCEASPTASSLTIGLGSSSGSSSENDEPPSQLSTNSLPSSCWPRLLTFSLLNPLLLLSWLLTFIIGLPLRYTYQKDVPLATFLLSATWLTTLAIQSYIKSHPSLRPWARTLLSGLSNAVLWTSLSMIAYVFADCAISGRPLADMLATLRTNTPLARLLLNSTSPQKQHPQTGSGTTMAAGDIAITLLNSGLVSWGLKLYSHQNQLLSRAGLTVCTVSAILALINVTSGPLLAHSMRVEPASRALAFAARSVTIALANPVMSVLQGDGGLNAAMVTQVPPTTRPIQTQTQRQPAGDERDEMAMTLLAEQKANDPLTVAAGVTVGINAAAMGTAYLYEAHSEAAPHAALSMIALGIMTVVFSSIVPLAGWVVERVGS
ncbi:hypothetical protein N0V88_001524 [Collariella sp. IMI 366227]|nr:hypothetical protein N0V88_001524 [Collariella sp. IMI 366227]